MKQALLIGVATAVLLSYIRGSVRDSPWVVILFGSVGFFGTLILSWMFRRSTLAAIENVLHRGSLVHDGMRNLLAAAIAISALFWSGPVIISGGFAGWLIALFLHILLPLVVCVTAAHQPIAFGLMSAGCISVSILLENARWAAEHGHVRFWADFSSKDLYTWLVIWGIGAFMSLIVSLPLHLQRRRLLIPHA
jgi:hypothetical protein